MTPTFGFPDFTQKASPGLDLLTNVNVNTGGTQTVDISALVQPSHQGILFYWVASFASLGQGINVQVGASFNSLGVTEVMRIFDGGTVIAALPGALLTSVAGNITSLLINLVPGDPAPVTGVLMVLGVNGTPLSILATRHTQIGHGANTGVVNVGTGATATVLATPAAGFYHRIKCLSWWTVAAPAAIARVTWNTSGTVALVGTIGGPAAGQMQSQVVLDYETDSLISLTNVLSVTVSTVVAYEIWPM